MFRCLVVSPTHNSTTHQAPDLNNRCRNGSTTIWTQLPVQQCQHGPDVDIVSGCGVREDIYDVPEISLKGRQPLGGMVCSHITITQLSSKVNNELTKCFCSMVLNRWCRYPL